mgnify:FL=1
MFRSAKNLLIVLIAPLTLFANPARAGIKATYLSVGGEAHTPISVRCSNDSTYTVTDSGLRIDTLVYPVYADDYNGYALVLPEAIIIDDKDGYTFAYYNFTTRHTTALRQKALGHRVCTEKRRYGSAFDYYREAITRPVVCEPYPGLYIAAGVSRTYGEFIRLRRCFASHLHVYGGIGMDLLMNGTNKHRFLWHAGVGYYTTLDDGFKDIAASVTIAESAVHRNLTLTLDVGYTHWLGEDNPIGLTGGVNIGIGGVTKMFSGTTPTLVWGFEVGIVIPLIRPMPI